MPNIPQPAYATMNAFRAPTVLFGQPDLQRRSVVGKSTTPATENMDAVLRRQMKSTSIYDDERFSSSNGSLCQPDLQCSSVVGKSTTPATENMDAVLGRQMKSTCVKPSGSVKSSDRAAAEMQVKPSEDGYAWDDGYMSDESAGSALSSAKVVPELHPEYYCMHEQSIGVQVGPATKAKGCQTTPARRDKSTQTTPGRRS